MIGILLISHGNMASGISSSLKMFFGSEIPQLETLCLSEDTNLDTFGEEIGNKIKELDTGDGVVVFVDLIGGTPCNQAFRYISSKVVLIGGMNLPIIMEFLGHRLDEIDLNTFDFNSLLDTGRSSLNKCEIIVSDDDEEF